MKDKYIFVYGLLKRGNSLNEMLKKNGRFIGVGTLKGFKLYSCGTFPAILKGSGLIHGEIYKVYNNRFNNFITHLDTIETGYKRELREVHLKNKTLNCWVYVFEYLPIGWELLENGKY